MSRKPQRTVRRYSPSRDVFKGLTRTPGGYSGAAQGSRVWNVSERRPKGRRRPPFRTDTGP
jgi:hypothetical protein